jgi:hypothetical protein
LLGVSATGIAIVKTGLVPSKISALGVEFAQADKRALLVIIGFVVLYFIVGFVLYAMSDFYAWMYRRHESGVLKKGTSLPLAVRTIVLFRLLFQVVLPMFIGAYSVLLLWTSKMD